MGDTEEHGGSSRMVDGRELSRMIDGMELTGSETRSKVV